MEVRLAKTAGFCFGVKRAVDLVKEQVALGKRVYTYGPIIHNEEVTEEKVENKFSGGNTKVVFGYLSLDLRNTKIEKNSTLKVLSVFGETEIFLPENVEVITSSSNILGGAENLRKTDTTSKKNNKIYIETLSILGNTRIR